MRGSNRFLEGFFSGAEMAQRFAMMIGGKNNESVMATKEVL